MGFGSSSAADVVTIEDDQDDAGPGGILPEAEQFAAAQRLKPSQIAMLIVEDCKRADALKDSVCLFCKKRVMVQTSSNVPLIYCQALNRDLEVSITRCTSFTPG